MQAHAPLNALIVVAEPASRRPATDRLPMPPANTQAARPALRTDISYEALLRLMQEIYGGR